MHAPAPDNTTPRGTVARNILYARHFLGLTQGDLARRLGRDRRQVSTWERGVVEPGSKTLAELSGALGRNMEWFLGQHPDVDGWFLGDQPENDL